MKGADEFSAKGVEKTFRIKLVRESTDGMFRADDVWLCACCLCTQKTNAIKLSPKTFVLFLMALNHNLAQG
ncbi:MAG: hypothetical protein ABFS56_34990, partial [Pseudomonadota bacterium]